MDTTFDSVHGQYGDRAKKLALALVRLVCEADSDFRDEVAQRALEGLWEAWQKYDSEKGADFWAYASWIIRGRVLDYQRETDYLSRRFRQIVNERGDDAIVPWHLRQKDDVADHEHHLAAGSDPETELSLAESGKRVEAMLSHLSPGQAEVVRRILAGDEGRRSIAADLGVGVVRVAQIYGDSVAVLRGLVCRCGEVRASCPSCDSRKCAENCCARATASTVLSCRGRALTVREWSRETGLPVPTIKRRLRRGASPEDALAGRHPGVRQLLSVGGETASVKEWARRRGISYQTLQSRLRKGWDAELAVSTAPGKGRRKLLATRAA